MIEQLKVEHLHCTFPKLSESNQFYVLGLTEGLKFAQQGKGEQNVNVMDTVNGILRTESNYFVSAEK